MLKSIFLLAITIVLDSSIAFAAQQADSTEAALSTLQRQLRADPFNTSYMNELQSIIQAHPSNARAHLLMAQCLERSGYQSLADDEYALADRYSGDDPASLSARFQRYMTRKDFKPARSILLSAQSKYADDPNTMYMQALYDSYSGDVPAAEAILQRLVKSSKPPAGAAGLLSAIRVKQGRYAEAIKLADIDLSMDSTLYAANAAKGIALMDTGKWNDAIAPLNNAFESAPFSRGIAQDTATLLYKTGRTTEALKPGLIDLVAATTPDDRTQARRLVSLLLLHSQDSDVTDAINKIKPLLAQPDRARLHRSIGEIYEGLGKTQSAVSQYEQALRLDPDSARTHYRLGLCLEKLDRYEPALEAYRSASTLAPNNEIYPAVASRLSSRLGNRKNDLSWQLKDWLNACNAKTKIRN